MTKLKIGKEINFVISCNKCRCSGAVYEWELDDKTANQYFKQDGWVSVNGKNWCPECYKKALGNLW